MSAGTQVPTTIAQTDRLPATLPVAGSSRRRPDGSSLVLGVAVVVAALLRMLDLGRVGLNSDEAVYAAQSASLAGNPHFTTLFPVVRAHPLLLQVLISPFYDSGVPDTIGRYVTAGFGIATVVLVYALGRLLYGRYAGAVAALLLAVMPYHVSTTRQLLLDGPMTFFATAALFCLAKATRSGHGRWLLAAGGCLGVAALSKETAIIMLGSAFVFVSLVNRLWRPLRYLLGGASLALGVAACYPLLTALAGGGRKGQSYLVWQLTRQPNHSAGFYLSCAVAMGVGVIAVGLLGLASRRVSGRALGWEETLLLSWAAVPVGFFEVWPVKGYSYLLPVAPVVALLAARVLCPPKAAAVQVGRRVVTAVATVACVVSLAVPAVAGVITPATTGLAGAGGLLGGREAGRWVAENVPDGAQLITIGPSMANLIQYYSGHRADGLSVSPNPLHRNPSYRPIGNADAALRAGTYRYIVWDAYSARRSAQFSRRAVQLAVRFHGRVVHTELGTFRGVPHQRLVVIYEVTP